MKTAFALLAAVVSMGITTADAAPAFSSTWSTRTSSFNSKTGEIEILDKVGDGNIDTIQFVSQKGDLGNGLPAEVQALRDMFYVIFGSTLRATVTGKHQFRVTCDDGCRARIDGNLKTPTQAWKFQGATKYTFDVDMVAGEAHEFEMELFEQSGHFDARFEVITPGSTQWVYVNSDMSSPRSTDAASTFVLGGRSFRVAARPATTANTAARELPAAQRCHGASTGPVTVPDGFDVAPDDAASIALASRYAYGAECLLVASGKALRTRPGASSSSNDRYCTEAEAGKLVTATDPATSAKTVDVSGDAACKTRVLLSAQVSALTGENAEAAKAAGDAAPAWAADGSGGQVRALSFRGKLYATLHNAPPASGAGDAEAATCLAGGLFAVPTGGWAVAPDTQESRAAVLGLRHTFGSTCLVLAGGASIDTITGAACPQVTAPTADFGTAAEGFVSVSTCPHSVLLVHDPATAGGGSSTPAGASAATSVVTWDADLLVNNPPAVPSTAVEIRGTQFSALTGLATRARGRGACQDVAVKVPSGWTVLSSTPAAGASVSAAQLEDRFSDAARFAGFGTYCLGRLGAEGKRGKNRKRRTCGSSSDVVAVTLADGSQYAAVTSCNAAAVITRPKPPPGPNELCGVCTGWGDPHFTTYDGVKWDFYGKGQYWVTAAYEDKHPDPAQRTIDWSVRSLQEPVKSATKHSMLRVSYASVSVEVRVQDGNRAAEPTLTVEGTVTDLADGASTTTSNGIKVSRKGNSVTSRKRDERTTYRIELPNAVFVEIRAGFWNLNLLDVRVELPNRYSGVTGGLCGNCDGDRSNDFRSPNCDNAATEADLKGLNRKEKLKKLHPFGESWSIGADGKYAEGTCGLPGTGTTTDPGNDPEGGDGPAQLPCEIVSAEVAARAQAACSSIGDETLRTACEDDVCATGDEGASGPAKENEADETENTTGTTPACQAATITRTTAAAAGQPLTHNGFEYALLDNTDPDNEVLGCQETPLSVPNGWRIAPDTALHRSALACHTWGASCVVFASGKSYTSSLAPCGDLELEASGPGLDCYAPTTCSRRVLLVRDAPRGAVLPSSSVLTSPVGGVATTPLPTGLGGWIDASVNAAGPSSITTQPEISWSGLPGTGSVLVAGASAGTPTVTEAGALLIVRVGASATGSPDASSATYVSREALGRGISVAAWSRTTREQGGAVSSDYSLYVDVVYEDGARVAHFTPFPTGVHDWVRRSVDVVVDLDPATGRTKPVTELRIFTHYRRRDGSAEFSDVTVDILSDAPFNLLRDGRVPVGTPEWISLGERGSAAAALVSISAASGTSDPNTGSIAVDTTGVAAADLESTSAGAYQGITLPANGGLTRAFGGNNERHTALYFGADVRTAAGESPSAYGSYRSLYVDATLDDGASRFGVFEPVNPSPAGGELDITGTKPAWNRIERVHAYDGNLRSFTLNALVRHTATKTDFDGLYATPTCSAGSRPNPSNGFSHGDPHVRSLDALPEGPDGWFDVHNIGEFVFYQDPISEIQVRHSIAGRASVNSAFHVRTPLMTVQIDRSTGKMAPVLRVNGRTTLDNSATASDPNTGARVSLVVSGDVAGAEATATYEITCHLPGAHPDAVDAGTDGKPLEHTFVVTAHRTPTGAQFLQAFVQVPAEYKGRTVGLLGNYDGDATNDLNLPDGTANTDPSVFAKAWELDPARSESAFVRNSGEDASRIRDTTFVPATEASFSAADLEAARAECVKVGVTSPALLRDCAFDAVAGGTSFATASGTARTQQALPVSSSMGNIVAQEESKDDTTNSSAASPRIGGYSTVFMAAAATMIAVVCSLV